MAERSPDRNPLARVSPRRAYAELAPFYRRVMEHVDYARWGRYLEKLLRLHRREPKSLLEVGAGTGTLSKFFRPSSLEFRVTTDICFEMISLAGETAGQLAVADACALPFTQKFDMILMTYDAVNYLRKRQLLSFFHEVKRLLAKGGVFVFDATTEVNSVQFFSDVWDVQELGGTVVTRHSVYNSKAKTQDNIFEFFTPKGELYERTHEEHRQYLYSEGSFRSALKKAGLVTEAVYADFTISRNLLDATRMQFVVGAAP